MRALLRQSGSRSVNGEFHTNHFQGAGQRLLLEGAQVGGSAREGALQAS